MDSSPNPLCEAYSKCFHLDTRTHHQGTRHHSGILSWSLLFDAAIFPILTVDCFKSRVFLLEYCPFICSSNLSKGFLRDLGDVLDNEATVSEPDEQSNCNLGDSSVIDQDNILPLTLDSSDIYYHLGNRSNQQDSSEPHHCLEQNNRSGEKDTVKKS
ncbi:hypothetical protein pdam_00019019 [Pocillopora damicornis]|uniref:Uncharacterized protein n=1 Tax=Pocillopora damicornis TaxID=46731 RepID=A0A3M6V1H4_POCDA|nr:hypothetical protein pdam_00019019 [Pocillopora damicornis]